MLYYTLLFLVLALLAAWFGFAAAAGTAAFAAKICQKSIAATPTPKSNARRRAPVAR